MRAHLGRKFRYTNTLGDIRYATCAGVSYSYLIGEWVVECRSPYGTNFVVPMREVLGWESL